MAATRSAGRRLRRLAVVVLAVAVLAHLLGWWYYSGRIGSDALAAQPWEWEADLRVVAASDAKLTVIDTDDSDREILSGDDYGLIWDGGFGRFSGAPQVDGDRVTVAFELVRGELPAAGTMIAPDHFWYPPQVSAPMRTVRYDGPLGRLSAAYLPADGSVWAVFVHGKGAAPDEMYRMMYDARAAGLPSLSISYRNDAGAPAAPSGRYGFGAGEDADLAAAVDYARRHGATGIVLGGLSMGGGIVASYLRHERPDDVRGIFLDCPMLDLATTVEYGADQIALPFGLSLPPTLTWGALRVASWRYDVDWQKVDYLSDSSWVTAPTLIVHGDADQTVPLSSSRELARSSDLVELVVVPGAAHAVAWNRDPAAYDARLEGFLKEVAR